MLTMCDVSNGHQVEVASFEKRVQCDGVGAGDGIVGDEADVVSFVTQNDGDAVDHSFFLEIRIHVLVFVDVQFAADNVVGGRSKEGVDGWLDFFAGSAPSGAHFHNDKSRVVFQKLLEFFDGFKPRDDGFRERCGCRCSCRRCRHLFLLFLLFVSFVSFVCVFVY